MGIYCMSEIKISFDDDQLNQLFLDQPIIVTPIVTPFDGI
jgi:hypothetical protein